MKNPVKFLLKKETRVVVVQSPCWKCYGVKECSQVGGNTHITSGF